MFFVMMMTSLERHVRVSPLAGGWGVEVGSGSELCSPVGVGLPKAILWAS